MINDFSPAISNGMFEGRKRKDAFGRLKDLLKKSNTSQASGLCKTSRSLTVLNNWTRILSIVNLREERGTDHDVSLTEEGGNLFTQIPGMRGGPNRTLRDRSGRLFNLTRPSETETIFGPDGKVRELSLKLFGQVELIRMRRRS